MPAPALDRRCWNHDAREASCLCLECGRAYCRECVTEHAGRLLCAVCLKRLAAAQRPGRGAMSKLASPALLALAVLLAWLTFWAAGEGIITVIRRMQQQPRTGARLEVQPPRA